MDNVIGYVIILLVTICFNISEILTFYACFEVLFPIFTLKDVVLHNKLVERCCFTQQAC